VHETEHIDSGRKNGQGRLKQILISIEKGYIYAHGSSN
jgi:hypothetical protein